MKQLLFCSMLVFLCNAAMLYGQEDQKGIHQTQLIEYNALGNDNASFYEAIETPVLTSEKVNCELNKVVYGWHPYWSGSAYLNYQWDLLSHMSFFSYEVNSVNGEANSTHGWSTSAAVDAALASGNTKVTLCVTLFSDHTTFFSSATSQQTLITNLINLVQSRGAHGVNIDFEGLPSAQTTNFANFMVDLCNQMHTAIPDSEVSTVLYAVDWNNVFDFSIMEPVVDHYIIMGYAYYYSGSSTAGPTDPLYQFGNSYNYTLSRSITYYLDKGCPKNKLILGLPSYGYEWPTDGLTIPGATTATGTSRTYANVKNNASGNYGASNYTWESDSYTDVYAFNNGENRQCFISLEDAWRKRLEHVNHTGIGGIGIWALSYDNGYTELWEAMNDYMTLCAEDSCSGIIHDFGGPTKNYYNNEDYTWTIAPTNATTIDIDFTNFDVENNFDYLYVYDGNSIASPQISGSPFTGLAGPGNFSTSSGAVTFRFTSDGATVNPGFNASYSCNTIATPIAGFSIASDDICFGDSIQLMNTSSDGETFSWSTSSGVLSDANAENPFLFITSSGSYDVTLTVTNGAGVDQLMSTHIINVNAAPVAIATASSIYVALTSPTVYFTNTSLDASNYFWDFGDASSSTDANPWHSYTTTGVFNVMFVASNAGCPNDTLFIEITVGESGIQSVDLSTIQISPNPFTDLLKISSDFVLTTIRMIDVSGREVYFKENIGETTLELSTDKMKKGVYFVEILWEDELRRIKVVKN